MNYLERRLSILERRMIEAIGSQVISLSLSNISNFYKSYIKENKQKMISELNRVGYYVLKNKVSIGNSPTTTKDIQICTYFASMDFIDECNAALANKYNVNVDIQSVGGFFVPATNELVVIVKVYNDDLEKSLKDADIRSTIEHELTHAFDHTNKDRRLADQNNVPGVGENFLSMCAYLGCASRSDIFNLMGTDILTNGAASECIYSISIILYKLFTITEFNAHQMSDLDSLHKVDINRSDRVRKALRKDILTDTKLTERNLKSAIKITPEKSPELWKIVGNVLTYMGYNLDGKSPSAVYQFFKRESRKLFDKFISRKMKNQVKAIISLREKNNLKEKIISCIKNNDMQRGVSFWFSPSGDTNSYLCRITASTSTVALTINRERVKLYGNADAIYKRAVDANNDRNRAAFEFAIDNLVDIIVQSIERNFNDIKYDPVYDITIPQDELQISKSNKISSRFADLDWD